MSFYAVLRFRRKGRERGDGRASSETGVDGGIRRYGARAFLSGTTDFSRAVLPLDHGGWKTLLGNTELLYWSGDVV